MINLIFRLDIHVFFILGFRECLLEGFFWVYFGVGFKEDLLGGALLGWRDYVFVWGVHAIYRFLEYIYGMILILSQG
jgi:hypothetical protein